MNKIHRSTVKQNGLILTPSGYLFELHAFKMLGFSFVISSECQYSTLHFYLRFETQYAMYNKYKMINRKLHIDLMNPTYINQVYYSVNGVTMIFGV